MEVLASVHVEMFSRLYSLRFELKDWGLGIRRTKSGASFVASFGPLHLGYSNINNMMKYLSDIVAESEAEYDRTRENGEIDQNIQTSDQGERVLH